MQVRYRYWMYPTAGQEQMLARTFGCARVVYNDSLRLRQEMHESGGELSDSEIQARVITLAKQAPERAWLNEVASVALVQACQDARRAYRNWFDSMSGKRKGRKVGCPRFRRKSSRQSIRLTRNGFAIRGTGRVYLAKIGEVKVRWSREVPCEPSSVTVIREPDGRYYLSFVVERGARPLPAIGREIGIDCGGGSSSSGNNGGPAAGGAGGVPTANLPVLQKIGKGEGRLNLIAWEGYLAPLWVKPFEQQTGCIVHATYAGSSDQMVTLMKNGGGLYDMVSSSGDADLRIIYGGDARPVNIKLIPSWNDFFDAFKSPPFNTVNGVHYGVWFSVAWHDPDVRAAFLLSIRVGLVAMGIALVLGSAVAYCLHKFKFFGSDAVSFLLVLPIALPGVITGIALNSFFSFINIGLSTLTIVIGHATFCIVIVYNNLIARLRRTPPSLTEASMDLGARGWQTQLYVQLPMVTTALVSGALLAFALSFDEVIVTVFTSGVQNTLPLWIFGAIRQGQQLPEVNAVVTIVILLTLIPVGLAARIAGAGAASRTGGR